MDWRNRAGVLAVDKRKKAQVLLRRYDLEEEREALLHELTRRGEALKRLGKDLSDNPQRIRFLDRAPEEAEHDPAIAAYQSQDLRALLDQRRLSRLLARLQAIGEALAALRADFKAAGLHWHEPG